MLHVVRCAIHAPQRPKNNANPSGLSGKNVYRVEILQFFLQGEISFLRGVGWVPQNSAHFGATAPA